MKLYTKYRYLHIRENLNEVQTISAAKEVKKTKSNKHFDHSSVY